MLVCERSSDDIEQTILVCMKTARVETSKTMTIFLAKLKYKRVRSIHNATKRLMGWEIANGNRYLLKLAEGMTGHA